MSSLPPAAGAARGTATPPSTPVSSFASFVLERVSRNPFLINETPRSLRPPSPQTAVTTPLSPAPHLAKNARDPTEDAPSIPSTLDAAQRTVIAQASISGSATTSISASASASAATAVLQRALIDAPLLPVGGCHLLYELVWPHLLASAEAAKQFNSYRKALQLYDARQATSATGTNSSLQGHQPHHTETTSLSNDGELKKTSATAAADIFAASPLASSPTDDQQHSDQSSGASPSTGTASLLQTPEELSQFWTRDVLQANMEQALTRLTGSQRELQRGFKKLRRVFDGLRAYDAVPFAELERQRQETVRNLFTPVVVAATGSRARDKGNISSNHAVLATEAVAAVSRGAPTVFGSTDPGADPPVSMHVFHKAIEKNGGPLPLLYYLQPNAGNTPDPGAAPFRDKSIDVLNTRVDRRTFFECVLSDADFAILTTFLMSGVPINATRDDDGASALHIAVAGTLEMLSGDDFHGGRRRGRSAGVSSGGGGDTGGIHAATGERDEFTDDGDERNGSTSQVLSQPCTNQLIISFLIDNGADVNAAMRGGLEKTPLMVAAARQNMRAVKLLLAKGADLNVQDARGRTVLSYAVAHPHVMETLRSWMGEEVFYEAAVRERLLCTACRSLGNTYAALYLIEQIGLDVNKRDTAATTATPATKWDGIPNRSFTSITTPIFFAGGALDGAHNVRGPAQSSTIAVPPTTSVSTTAAARSLAHIPCSGVGSEDETAVEVISTRALSSGDTPLHCAVSAVDVALVRALLRKGADVHAVNNSGATPLQLAQSQSSFVQSRKQYWKDELIMLLRPTSASAAAARRRCRERHRDKNPHKVRALLMAYSRANTAQSRDQVLRDESELVIWQLCTPMGVVQLVATATLPHAFYFVCCRLTRNFMVLSLLPLLCVACLWMQRRGSRRAQIHPLCDVGWCGGLIVAQGVCLPLSIHYYKYLSVTLDSYYMLSWWLFPSVIATVLLAARVVLFSSTGYVTSTEGQRKGIYASLRKAKDEYPKELLYGVDLRTMVKKPLRAQHCPQMRRVVLRYDHFCSYLSTAIGGSNHRAFLWLHVALLSLLICLYYYAREHSRLVIYMGSKAYTSVSVTRISMYGEIVVEPLTDVDRGIAEKLKNAMFMTAGSRFTYMYSQLILPLMVLMTAYILLSQLLAIARNLTFYDLEHSEDESSLYCFTLGNVVYSLFDHGKWVNLREFFGWSSLTQQVYRVPKINPYLQRLVEDHQRWQLTNGDACCGSHGHQHQPCTRASGASDSSGAAAAAAATGTASTTTTTGEMAGPAGWGDKSARAPQVLRAQQREALAAAAVPASIGQPRQGREVVQPEQQSTSQAEESGKEYGEAEDYGDGSSALAMQIFQEMVSSGSADVGHGNGLAAAAMACRGSGAGAVWQREWDAAVEKAREMYDYYLQSMRGDGDDG